MPSSDRILFMRKLKGMDCVVISKKLTLTFTKAEEIILFDIFGSDTKDVADFVERCVRMVLMLNLKKTGEFKGRIPPIENYYKSKAFQNYLILIEQKEKEMKA